MMAAVAFLALALAVIVQSVRLHQALVREQQLRAEVVLKNARLKEALYPATLARAQAERQRRVPPVAPKP
jgi:hypothetical protein